MFLILCLAHILGMIKYRQVQVPVGTPPERGHYGNQNSGWERVQGRGLKKLGIRDEQWGLHLNPFPISYQL